MLKSKRRQRPCTEMLEQRRLLAATFGDELPVVGSDATYPKYVTAGDLDGDDDLDLVFAGYDSDRVSWFENTDGQGTFGPQRVLSEVAIMPTKVELADLDGDGDLDVITTSAGQYDADVSWYENTDGQATFGPQRIITAQVALPDSIAAADLDGDGDLDVLSASRRDNKVAWYENEDGAGTFGDQQIFSDEAEGATTVVAGDLDGDGDVDVVAGSAYDDTISWFENDEGQFNEHTVIETAEFVVELRLADIDVDGSVDLVSVSRTDDTISWFRWDPEANQFGVERVITVEEDGPNTVTVADMNGDTLPDLLVGSRFGDRTVLLLQAEQNRFETPAVISDETDGASAVWPFDMDGDGDLDIATSSRHDNKVAVQEHLDESGTFGPQQVLTSLGMPAAQYVSTADIDGDGDQDVLSASFDNDSIWWSEHLDGQGAFADPQLISDRNNGAESIVAADFDGDGDMDVIASSFYDNKITWHENLDGQGSFGPQRFVTGDARNPEEVRVADVDGDGDVDVLSVSRGDSKVAWYSNLDGNGLFGPQQIISVDEIEPTTIRTADLDGDGDLDVLVNAYAADNSAVVWHENTDGQGTFGPQRTITLEVEVPSGVAAGDLDGDGDLDIVSASLRDDRVAWYPNLDGQGDFSSQFVLSDEIDTAFAVELGDLDGDGDLEIVVLAPAANQIGYFDNLGGGEFSATLIPISVDSQLPVALWLDDLDGNDTLDVLASLNREDKTVWFQNEGDDGTTRGDFNEDGVVDADDIDLLCAEIQAGGTDAALDLTGDGVVNRTDFNEMIIGVLETTFGDANVDGVFSTSDFVQVFQVGQYEDGVAGNSTWATGDWNCDGEFSSSDLIFAFQFGGFEAAARPPSMQEIAAAIEADD